MRRIRFVRLFFRDELLRRLALGVRRNSGVGLPSRGNGNGTRQDVFNTNVIRCNNLRRRRSTGRRHTRRLPKPSIMFSFVEGLPHRRSMRHHGRCHPKRRLRRGHPKKDRIRQISVPNGLRFRGTPTLMDTLHSRRTPCYTMRNAFFVSVHARVSRPTRRHGGKGMGRRRRRLLLPRYYKLYRQIRRLHRRGRQRRRPTNANPRVKPVPRERTGGRHHTPTRRHPRRAIRRKYNRDAPPV